MILGINYEQEDREKDLVRITFIVRLEDDSHEYCLENIENLMKNFDTCLIVPERNAYPYMEGSIGSYNNTIYWMKHKFIEYSKANHSTKSYNEFIYAAGVMHGRITSANIIQEKLNQIKGLT